MKEAKKFERYPIWIVVMSNLVSLTIFGLGCFILSRVGIAFALLFLLYFLLLEYRLLKNHCTNCYYWGKVCGFGQGKLSAWFFKQGDASRFCGKKVTWKSMLPDLMVSLIPAIIAIPLLILDFDWVIFSALLLLLLITSFGNEYVRGKLTCKYCRQRELGCPADLLFAKKSEELSQPKS